MSKVFATVFFVLSILGVSADADSAAPHEEGVLTLGSASPHAGGTLDVSGSDFTEGTTYSLVLEGTLESYEVGTVTADAEGGFHAGIEVPADARPGAYRLVAVAPDGDEAATADLTLEPPAADAASAGRGGPEEHGTAPGPVARAEERDFERSWAAAEWFVVGLVVGGGLVGGLTLYRSRPAQG